MARGEEAYVKETMLVAGMILSVAGTAGATDVVNQDGKPYKLKVQSEG